MNSAEIPAISPNEANAMLNRGGDCMLIDVREYSEWAAEHAPGAKLAPLSTLARNLDMVSGSGEILVLCQTGNRAMRAARMLRESCPAAISVVEGGLLGWKAAGLPVIKGASRVWALERQVRFTAGALVLAGGILTALLSPWFILLPAAIGSGLMYSAATDTCAMGMVLAKMPWNRAPADLPHAGRGNLVTGGGARGEI